MMKLNWFKKTSIDIQIIAAFGIILSFFFSLQASAQSTISVSTAISASAPNPEYDRLIAEAQTVGKDPVDYAMEKWKSEDWASRLDVYILKRAAMKRQEGERKIDEAAITDEMRIAKKSKDLIKSTKVVIDAMKVLERNWKFWTEQIAEVNKMYASPTLPKEVKDMIFQEFGRYIKKESIATQN